MKLDLTDVSDMVLLDVLNDVAPFSVERTGETRDSIGVMSVVDGLITFYGIDYGIDSSAYFTLHRSDILNIIPVTS